MVFKRAITWPWRNFKRTVRVLAMVVLAPFLILLDAIIYLPYRMIVGGIFGNGVRSEVGAAMSRWKGWLIDIIRGGAKLAGAE